MLEPVLFSVKRSPHWVSFGVTDPEAIVHTLRQDNVQAKFRHHTVSLEDAFVYHVGELTERFNR